ncbi:MAG: MBL fold metallo-hydrolase [Gammaproteobacteria bacterium]
MSLRFAYLGSGSRGNSALISNGDTTVMLDCGFSVKESHRRLDRLGVDPDDIDALLVTHEHSDHITGVGAFARRHNVAVHLTDGTFASGRTGDLPDRRSVYFGESFDVGRLSITPIPVPHDAREPVQYRFSDGGRELGILTDLGHITPVVREAFADCDALVVECNHDLDMLSNGPYPRALKERVAGHYGHLNNAQAAELLADVEQTRLQHVLAVHVSEKNNTTDLARDALRDVITVPELEVDVACQNDGTAWREIL